jgi:hypothetical protein
VILRRGPGDGQLRVPMSAGHVTRHQGQTGPVQLHDARQPGQLRLVGDQHPRRTRAGACTVDAARWQPPFDVPQPPWSVVELTHRHQRRDEA